MNLLFFEVAGATLLVVQKPVPPSGQPVSPDTRWNRMRDSIHAAYQKFKERFDHNELVCGNLRHAESLQVVHQSGLSAVEVEKKLRRFLELRYSKHRRWLVVDFLLAVAGIVLTPLPGPNIFFFYPAARALAHYFAKTGAKKALQLSPQFVPEPLIDCVQGRLERLDEVQEAIQELERRYDVESLGSQLGHLKARSR